MARVLTFILLCAAVARGQAAEPWRSGAPAGPAAFRVLISPGQAPAVVHVDAVDCPLAVGTPLTTRYDWDFGDPAGKYDQLPGFNAAHLYDAGGTYTIKLTVTDSAGSIRVATAKVIIGDDVRRQIFVSATGADSNDGRTSQSPIRTADKAFKMLTDGCEIRFKAGGTFPADSTLTVHRSDVVVGRYGGGADPVLLLQRVDEDKAAKTHGHHGFISLDGKCDGVLIERLTFDTPFGVADDAPAPKVGIDAVIARGRNVSFREVTFRNLDTAVNSNGKPTGLLVQDCRAPGKASLRAYLVWGEGTNHVYLHNSCDNSTREHCVRLSGVQSALIWDNDFTNLDRRPADKDDFSKGTIEMHRGAYAYISGNAVTGGTIRVGPRGGDSGEDKSTATDWSVIENNRVTDTFIIAYAGAHHVMIRDNTITGDDRRAIELAEPDKDGRVDADFTIVHNTATNMGTHGTFIKVGGHVDGITLVANRYVAPNLVFGNGTAVIYAENAPMADFKAVFGNVWPAAGGPGAKAIVVEKQWKTPADWAASPGVKAEAFGDEPQALGKPDGPAGARGNKTR